MKILVYDNGLCSELAVTLARAGHNVAYVTPWQSAFPKAAESYIGRGLEGLTVTESFTKALEACDLVVCPDTFSEDRVTQAGDARKPVWGAGAAERLELDRPYMKDLQQSLKLPTGKFIEVTGVQALMDKLQYCKDKWVKTSKYRQYETFYHEDWESTRAQHLGVLLSEYGPAGNDISFIIEDPIEGVEVGLDMLFSSGRWHSPSGYGYEAKDSAYVGTHALQLPKPLKIVADALQRPLSSYGANSFVSAEVRVGKDGKGYMIEPTVRAPHPVLAGMLEMYDNIDRALIEFPHVATELQAKARYVAVLNLWSSHAGDHWTEVVLNKPSNRRFVKLSQACRLGGKYFAVPGNEYIGYAVGLGSSLVTAARMAKEVAATVHARGLDYDAAALDRLIEETVPEGKKYGIEF